MSYPVKVSVDVTSPAGASHSLTDYNRLTLSQHVLTHHTFALDMSCEALGKALGLKPEVVPTQAHEQLSGGDITIGWTSKHPEPGGAGRSFRFKGIVTHISVQTDADLVNYYHISGYSPTFLFEDGTQSRTFVKKSVQDIFSQVLGVYHHNALKQELKAEGKDVLPYTVQYNETAFNFLSRVAAQYNEWFYYDGETLRLGRGPGKTIAFTANGAQVFTLSMHLQPGKTEGAAYNYRTHEPLKTQAAAPAGGHAFSRFAVQKSDELFTQPHRLPARDQVRTQAQLQRSLDGLAAKRAVNQVSLEGSGEAFDTAPGCVLDVQDAAGTAYGKFRVLAVRHELDGDGNYTNHFEAMPDAGTPAPPNPLYTASDAQPELALVIDVADPKRLGRLRVRYPWAVAQPTDAESGWVRVSTPYSGDGKGQLFTPEVGSQVLVGYEHGLAEFPVVLGNLFHERNPQGAKYTNPNNHLKGLQTAGGNKFVMNDVAGAQTILLSNSNKKTTAITVSFENDGKVHIQSAGPVAVNGSNITLEAGAPGKGGGAYTGDILLRAKTITMAAEQEVKIDSLNKTVAVKAKTDFTATAEQALHLTSTGTGVTVSGGPSVDIKAGKVKVNS